MGWLRVCDGLLELRIREAKRRFQGCFFERNADFFNEKRKNAVFIVVPRSTPIIHVNSLFIFAAFSEH